MKNIHALALLMVAGLGIGSAQAANWIQAQGSEPANSAAAVRVWGFTQMEYQETTGSKIAAGPWADQPMQANQIAPDNTGNSSFAVRRARLGVRGLLPGEPQVNYMLTGEFGNNGTTRSSGGVARLFDASITVNLAPALRLRTGQFKQPVGEEALTAAYMRDYINLTNGTSQLISEKFFNADGASTTSANAPNGPSSSFHDVGIQLFGIIPGSWEHTYAVMVGNGNGIMRTDNNANKELYLYWSSERVFGGKGGHREGWKVFAWRQSGKRTLETNEEYLRLRYGAGTTYRRGPYRVAAEYIMADGMIPNGTDGGAIPGSSNNTGTAIASYNLLPEDKANAWYLDVGYRLHPKWEADMRYDVLNRGTDSTTGERCFNTLTLGLQYTVNKASRLMANYEVRKAEAPGQPDTSTANQILDNTDNRLSLQLQVAFK